MASKLIDSVDLLLRLEKQKMDQLRLETFKTEEQLNATLRDIEALNQKIIEERNLTATQITAGHSYKSFSAFSQQKQEEYLLKRDTLKNEYNRLLDELHEKFADTKAYEKTIERWLALLKKEEERAEQAMFDEIALKKHR